MSGHLKTNWGFPSPPGEGRGLDQERNPRARVPDLVHRSSTSFLGHTCPCPCSDSNRLSPKRPRCRPPHCLKGSKNFATRQTWTDTQINPFNKATRNDSANLPPLDSRAQRPSSLSHPLPKDQGYFFFFKEKQCWADYLAHQLLSAVQMYSAENVVSLQRLQQ